MRWARLRRAVWRSARLDRAVLRRAFSRGIDWRRVWSSVWVVLVAVAVGFVGWWFPEVFPEYVADTRADRGIGWINITNLSASVLLLLLRTRSRDWTWLVRAIVWVFVGLVCLYLFIVAGHEGWSFFRTPNWVWALRFEVAWGSLVYTLALIAGEVNAMIDRRWRGRFRRRLPDSLTPDVILATIAEAKPIVIADETGRIVYATASIEDLVGGPVEGLDVVELVPPRYRTRHLAGLRRFAESGEGNLIGRVVAAPLLRRDGSEVPVHLALSSADAGGRRYIVASLWRRDTEVVLE